MNYETCIANVAKAIQNKVTSIDAFTASIILAIAFDKTKEEVLDDLVSFKDSSSVIPCTYPCTYPCTNCGADLSKEKSVTREYINKDGGDSVFGSGHYGSKDIYVPDVETNLSGGRYDLHDGSDSCSNCDAVVG